MPKILIIDDDPAIRRLIAATLERHGHSVVVAADGVAGAARQRAELPDLVITDMNMPDQDGAETISMIRQTTPHARIIAISGGGNVDGTNALLVARRLGATDILRKPFTMRQLRDCVSRALDRLLAPGTHESPV